jgi:hypothetical protein
MTTESQPEFVGFPKIARLNRLVTVSEKIDGTNACVFVTESGDVFAGSRNRWLTPENDNFGFARWVEGNKPTLLQLGPGRHFGEWWGSGIQRGYGLRSRRFSLFNTLRWAPSDAPVVEAEMGGDGVAKVQERVPEGLFVVPELRRVNFCEMPDPHFYLDDLRVYGSEAAPGFMPAEGIVVLHTAAGVAFKMTFDDGPKGLQ